MHVAHGEEQVGVGLRDDVGCAVFLEHDADRLLQAGDREGLALDGGRVGGHGPRAGGGVEGGAEGGQRGAGADEGDVEDGGRDEEGEEGVDGAEGAVGGAAALGGCGGGDVGVLGSSVVDEGASIAGSRVTAASLIVGSQTRVACVVADRACSVGTGWERRVVGGLGGWATGVEWGHAGAEAPA